jgi:hypothetical protein
MVNLLEKGLKYEIVPSFLMKSKNKSALTSTGQTSGNGLYEHRNSSFQQN